MQKRSISQSLNDQYKHTSFILDYTFTCIISWFIHFFLLSSSSFYALLDMIILHHIAKNKKKQTIIMLLKRRVSEMVANVGVVC